MNRSFVSQKQAAIARLYVAMYRAEDRNDYAEAERLQESISRAQAELVTRRVTRSQPRHRPQQLSFARGA